MSVEKQDPNNDGHDILVKAAAAAIDKAISGTLDAFEEHYADVITATASDGESSVDMTCTSGLSGLYFDEINS
ncbi:hypothetical protein D3C78_1515370 [compost metagenome]